MNPAAGGPRQVVLDVLDVPELDGPSFGWGSLRRHAR